MVHVKRKHGDDAYPHAWPAVAFVLGVLAAEVGLVLAKVPVFIASGIVAGALTTGIVGWRLLCAGPMRRLMLAPPYGAAEQLASIGLGDGTQMTGGMVVPFDRGEGGGGGAPRS